VNKIFVKFIAQVDGFMRESNNSNGNDKSVSFEVI
jgi:hypothetical protein